MRKHMILSSTGAGSDSDVIIWYQSVSRPTLELPVEVLLMGD